MKIRGRVLEVNNKNLNGQYVNKYALRRAIEHFTSDFKNGYFHFESYGNDNLDLDHIAGNITKLDIEDGYFIMEGETIPTPSGLKMEAALKYGGHFSIALNAYYKDDFRINNTNIEEIKGFCVNQRQEPLEDWEVKEIKEVNKVKAEYEDECISDDEVYFDCEEDSINGEKSNNFAIDKIDESDVKTLLGVIKKILKNK